MTTLTAIENPDYKHLFDYQFEGARWLASRKRGALGDDPGLGKSAQAIAACDMIEAQSVLVICPASLAINWEREVQKFAKTRFEFHAASYDKVARNLNDYMGSRYSAVIIDEAHYLKSREAKRTQAIYGANCDLVGYALASQADRVWLLSGTLMPNSPSELWTHLRALAPELIGHESDKKRPMPFWVFAKKFCHVRQTAFGWQIGGGKNLDELKKVMGKFMLRRRKEDVLDLPPMRWDTLYVEGRITGIPTAEAAQIKEVLEKQGVDGLAGLAGHVATLRRMTAVAKIDPTVRYVKEFLEYSTESIVVFAHHKEVLDALYTELKEVAVMVRGDTAQIARQKAVDDFQAGTKRVFLGQIQAAGTGITLTKASNLLLVEQSWVPAENAQAAMRISRIGQVNACLVRAVTLAGSIDEDIQRALLKKAEVITEVLG